MNASDRFIQAIDEEDESTALKLLQEDPTMAKAVGVEGRPSGDDGTKGIFNTNSPTLHLATELGLTKLVEALLDAGVDVTTPGFLGGTALHWAAWMGYDDIVGLLIGRGAPLEVRDREFDATPLHWAVHGFRHHLQKHRDTQHGRAQRDHVSAAARLLGAGANVHATNLSMTTAAGEESMSELLRRYGAKDAS